MNVQNCVQKIPSTTLPNISINITPNLNNIFINISLFSYKIHKKLVYCVLIIFDQLKNEVKCRLRRIEKLTHLLGHHRTAVFQIILHHPLYQHVQEGFIKWLSTSIKWGASSQWSSFGPISVWGSKEKTPPTLSFYESL